jgi:hypothetical protein
VQSDTEASSEDTDPEEDSNAVARRREEREVRKAISEKRVKRLRQKGRLVEQHRTVDQVTEWMDGRLPEQGEAVAAETQGKGGLSADLVS